MTGTGVLTRVGRCRRCVGHYMAFNWPFVREYCCATAPTLCGPPLPPLPSSHQLLPNKSQGGSQCYTSLIVFFVLFFSGEQCPVSPESLAQTHSTHSFWAAARETRSPQTIYPSPSVTITLSKCQPCPACYSSLLRDWTLSLFNMDNKTDLQCVNVLPAEFFLCIYLRICSSLKMFDIIIIIKKTIHAEAPGVMW